MSGLAKEDWIVDTVKKLERIYQLDCKSCGKGLFYTVTTADTDMVPTYCGSAYAPDQNMLAVAELTGEEYRFGCKGRLPERMEGLFGGRFVYLKNQTSCPLCGGALQRRGPVSWEAYAAGGGRAAVVFYDENYRQKVREML